MKTLLLVFLLTHVAVATTNHAQGRSGTRSPARYIAMSVTQLILFLIGLYVAYDLGAISRGLLSPVYIGAGLLLGHLIFGMSLLAIHRSLEDATSYFLDFGALWRFVVDHPYVMSRFVLVGVTEEIVWRAAAQPVVVGWLAKWMGGGAGLALGIVLVAVAFSLVHEHFFRNSLVVSLEFLVFALLLGILYYATGSLILVIIIHALRDIEICYLEYILKVDEYGDEKRAADDIERMYMRPARHE